MDSKIPTSFIPKESLRAGNRPVAGAGLDFVTLGALLIFAAAAIYLAGSYGYRYLVYRDINRSCAEAGTRTSCGLKASLAIETRELEIERLEYLKRLDTKLNNGANVLSHHTTLSPLFDLLGRVTVQNVQYRQFQFDGSRVSLSGVARSYEDIAYQQRLFASDPTVTRQIRNFVFSDFGADGDLITFKLAFSVDPALLAYGANRAN